MLKSILAAGLLASATFLPAATAMADDADPMPVRLHRYTAPLYAWNTNSYWLESKDGVVLIDAQLLKSDAHYLAAQIKASGKPLMGVIVTHGHNDHVGGLAVLRDELGAFPVYATEATKASVPHYMAQGQQFFAMPNRFGEALDARPVELDHMIKAGDTLTIAGMELEVIGGGAGEAEDNIGIYAPALKAVFSGDMSYPFCHFYTGDGHPDGALKHLQALKEKFEADTYVYSGHNNPARVSQLDDQIAYVSFLIDSTKAAMAVPANLGEDGMLTRPARRTVFNAIMAKYPNYDSFGYAPLELVPGSIYGVEQAVVALKKAAE